MLTTRELNDLKDLIRYVKMSDSKYWFYKDCGYLLP